MTDKVFYIACENENLIAEEITTLTELPKQDENYEASAICIISEF